ncbi:hypothetical protein D0439_10010 [Lysinibacillus fusiformis]|uniref:hypothetical protein n=1 Tax=Lysinibacillus fusiformis TaxID=28031 RepID=UPI0011BBF339|nr:hypothetical protein [Lysinibacillus fusiformis]MCT6818070.1 hypothetical protein [Lysinibacillus fusiformis]MCT6927395.1 hypothetical protein [Lysinibacillus fusiformis]MCT6931731.1 hypothetical protein [Lysinibacillus fusiformis]QDZ98946.1 hypothetical protein D0439_10010 [Lysinibacillus fusiformis]
MIGTAPSESTVIKTLFEMSGITKERITSELRELISETARHEILFWDIDDIMRATTFKKTFLEEHILCDPRIKQYERQRGYKGKRVWLYEPTAKAIKNIIMNEWN